MHTLLCPMTMTTMQTLVCKLTRSTIQSMPSLYFLSMKRQQAYFSVQSLARLSCSTLFIFNRFAMSGTSGSIQYSQHHPNIQTQLQRGDRKSYAYLPSGFGSFRREQMDKRTAIPQCQLSVREIQRMPHPSEFEAVPRDIVRAGLQLSLRMSKQIPPLSFTLQ